ncbi:O-antigen polymerase [Bacillus sp. FJAT-28004]|uniref:O-antigen polymerase n=1 Tax=Bacillus sp. FJAT-28004 TaxID=1679165 RepID=UPI0006B45E82|nr:O-antigen polymerase [Bacillus sp. FJAT-28004]
MVIFAILVIIVVMLVGSWLITRSWWSPTSTMVIYWSFFIVFSMFVFKYEYNWSYSGVLWILAACVFFGLGNTVGNALSVQLIRGREVSLVSRPKKSLSRFSWYFIILCITMGIIRIIIDIIANGFTFQSFLNLNAILDMNETMAYQRYSGGEGSNNVIMQLLLVFVYAGPLCGGYASNYRENKFDTSITFLTFVPVLLSLLFNNGKAGLIACVLLWISGYIVGFVEKNKKLPSFRMGTFFKFILSLIIALIFLYISMLMRIGDFSESTRSIVYQKFMVYAFGNIPAFDYGFSSKLFLKSELPGQFTFVGIYNTLGFTERLQGVYKFGITFTNGYFTNVFTSFFGIISDFGYVGGLLFFSAIGVISGFSLNRIINLNGRNIMTMTVLSSIYFFIFYSFIISPWSYSSYILSMFVFMVYLWLTILNRGK